jgi:hypothetical protein
LNAVIPGNSTASGWNSVFGILGPQDFLAISLLARD